jgi:hypothetical protein
MAYRIKQYTKDQAKKIGVEVKPSSKKGKKIDVIKGGKIIASIGAIGYGDYPTFLEQEKKKLKEKGYAAKRRILYKKRHEKYRNNKGTNSYYADKLLW